MTKTKTEVAANNDTYHTLRTINVTPYVRKKGPGANAANYLPWANAWDLTKREYPDAKRTVHEDPQTGWPYFTDTRTAWVKVSVEINGREETDIMSIWKPVFKSNPIAVPLEDVTSFHVNTAIQRCTVKCLALHGLGIDLWMEEDDLAEEKEIANVQKVVLKPADQNWDAVVKYVKGNHAMTDEKLTQMLGHQYEIDDKTLKMLLKIKDTEATMKQRDEAPEVKAAPAEKEVLPLAKNDKNWTRVVNWVIKNSEMTAEQVFAELGKGYALTDDVKAELGKLIKGK